jgi:hypothetical protein
MNKLLNILLTAAIITLCSVFIFNRCNNKNPTEEINANLYLVAYDGSSAKGKVFGCNDILVPVTKKIIIETSGLEAALNELISQTDNAELHNFVKGPGLFLLKVLIANNRAEVYLKGDFDIISKCDIERIRQQIYETTKQFDEYKEVRFYIGNLTLEKYLSIAEAGFK